MGGSVCVLAVEGYGEESNKEAPSENAASSPISPFAAAAAEMGNDAPAVVRGPRPWRETVGGGSICCSQCCSVLGFATLGSPETYRFLKHRLVTREEPKVSDDARSTDQNSTTKVPRFVPLTPCSRFVAREMIRYAETKAIFTFVVERNEPGVQGRLLLLELLSWDSQFAINADVTYLESIQGGSHLVQDVCFQRTAKIIFEETWLDLNISADTRSKNETEDISSWIWGGADLCCLPGSAGATQKSSHSTERKDEIGESSGEATPGLQVQGQSTSSVRLLLETNEWDELRESLQEGAQFFSKEIAEATVAAKLGRRNIPHRSGHELSLGLSVMPLDK